MKILQPIISKIKQHKTVISVIIFILFLSVLFWVIYPKVIKHIQADNQEKIDSLFKDNEYKNILIDSLKWNIIYSDKKEGEWKLKFDSLEKLILINKQEYESTIDSITNRTSDELNNVIDGAINDALNEWNRQSKSKFKIKGKHKIS